MYNGDKSVSELIGNIIKRSCNVLVPGCGNSKLAEDMHDDGYFQITNFDISQICIKKMRERNKEKRPSLTWNVMDARCLDYPNNTFDLIIDKSTIDSILCGSFPNLNVSIMMSEI